ncbi:MAG: universal stress protein [Anaerolineae bacterium]
MIKNVLLPLDGSPLAEGALPFASRLARGLGATLNLVRVPDAIVAPTPGMEAVTPLALCSPEARADAEDYLERVAAQALLADLDVKRLTPDPPVVAGVMEAAQQCNADLLVMTSHGYSGLKRFILGSVTDELVRHAACDVVVVPAGNHAKPAISRIAVPLDGSALSEAGLARAAQVALALGASLHLLQIPQVPIQPVGHAVPGAGLDWVPELVEEATREAQAYLDAKAAELRAQGVTVTAQQEALGIDGVAGGILDAARERQADLLLLTSHGRGGLRRLVLGSVTDALLRKAELPVWVVRPHGEEAGEP